MHKNKCRCYNVLLVLKNLFLQSKRKFHLREYSSSGPEQANGFHIVQDPYFVVNILLYALSLKFIVPSNTIWWQRSGSTLAQVMACCLTAPSHYLNQCWLITKGFMWYSFESNFIRIAQDIESENYTFKIISASRVGRWVKLCVLF